MHFFVCQFAVSLNTFSTMSFHVVGPCYCFCVSFCLIHVVFQLLQQKYVIQKYLFFKLMNPTLVAEQVENRAPVCLQPQCPETMPNSSCILWLYPVCNGLQKENLDHYMFDVEAVVAGTKPEKRKLLSFLPFPILFSTSLSFLIFVFFF